ncbi:TRAP transporter large permease [Pusillimonas sp. ANT_WB101]|uniref:TRAP transporter large permease n=1 Tax=Pusillimonas sp. ANT_WB101 TaxID=2597356 RepID=UPI0011F08FF0|nr:TRAP transporter large permease [Pusillimonas sp. ANT_WB101]KAA0911139.1 TRAP transporter large permease [Pusillimonas sp. ANT_WB101]
MSLVMIFAGILALVFLGVPILLSIATVSLAGIMLIPELVPALMPQKAFAMLDSFSLLALPYFILAGAIMTRGGLSAGLIEFSQKIVGHIRGSLGHTAVLSCVALANISGSSTAEAAAVGSVIIPPMKAAGYRPGYAASIVAAAATVGPIIPPSMTMIIYGSITGVSIGGLFMAGVIPGIIIAILLMTLIYAMSYLPAYPELRHTLPRSSLREIKTATIKVWPALLAPVIIMGGILGGIFTATEAGIVACVYSLVVSMTWYRILRWRDLPSVLVDAAVTTAMVAGVIGMAGVLGWLLSYLNFNDAVLGALRGITDSSLLMLLLLIIIMLVLTMMLDGLAVVVVMVPTIVYVGNAFHIDPLHLGVLMVMITQIGGLTPPVAILLFVTSSIARIPFAEGVRAVWPFVAVLLLSLILVMLVPALATWLPSVALKH